jgi:FkbM family methyltransferase
MRDASPRAPGAIDMLRHVLAARPGGAARGVAVDVGAHVGGLSRALLDSALFDRVIAFEPRPENADALERLENAGALRVERSAVGERAGEAVFHFDDDTATGSLLPYGEAYANRGTVRALRVPVVTLDDHGASALHEAPVALLKIDTQGHDLAVIRGAARTIARDRPVVMAEVIYIPLYRGQARPAEILAAMEASGYELYALFNIHATVEGRLAFADALFAPREWQVPHTHRFVQLDEHESLRTQIGILDGICRERLDVINVLDAEVKRLASLQRG